jgi:hypothetical protein
MARTEHFNDPNAQVANNLVPAASAVVADQAGGILLIERTDNGLWTIPGGGMEVGETIAHTAIREVKKRPASTSPSSVSSRSIPTRVTQRRDDNRVLVHIHRDPQTHLSRARSS